MLSNQRASAMKVNSTVALTIVLLILMLGAGYISAIWGFAIGHEAVKGVTQPDARPISKIKIRNNKSGQQRAVEMLKEEDIVTNVRARIEGKGKNAKPEKPKPQNQQSSRESDKKTQLTATEAPQPGFPLSNKNQGVTLEVLSARYSGGALRLKVNFKNEGDRTVKFLYSFLTVKDDQGRLLSANTEGLPEELPPNGKTFSGTVSVSTATLNNVKKLSMTLTDYPGQQLQLQMANIPVNSL